MRPPERSRGASPELGDGAGPGGEPGAGAPGSPLRHRRGYLGGVGLVVLVLIALNAALQRPAGGGGLAPGSALPPFAAPLVGGSLEGDADVATRPGEGAAGRVPACAERGPEVLNICQLYEQGPVVLAMFVPAGGCPRVLDEMQQLAGSYPAVRFAAVSIGGARSRLRALVASHRLTFPVAIDRDGAVAGLYRVASCPQLTFARRGGVTQGHPFARRPSSAELAARVAQLLAESRAAGAPR